MVSWFIADFLTRMATTSGAARVHIIAHSMGNRGLLRAIDRIASRAASRAEVPFNQIILAAADVDRDTFARLSVAYKAVARLTTMYVCALDGGGVDRIAKDSRPSTCSIPRINRCGVKRVRHLSLELKQCNKTSSSATRVATSNATSTR
jgi:esterase/lipase superfamily enzyme